MGLIGAAAQTASSTLADQWLEFFYCDALPADVLVSRGHKKSGRSSNKKGSDNVISNGSVLVVAEGQCMIIVDQGKIVDVCAQPGQYTYDVSSEPSLFFGDLKESAGKVLSEAVRRFAFGGRPSKDQRVYYFNIREIIGNNYGTPAPVPFRVVDSRAGIDIDIGIRCFGEYSYKIVNPVLFYANVCGNVEDVFTRQEIDSQMKSELLTALQPAFARISDMGIRYSALPGHTDELASALKEELSEKWSGQRGIQIQQIGISAVNANPEDEKMIKELQRNAAFKDPSMAAAQMTSAAADAMKLAAGNTSAGPAMAFMGMNMAQQAGGVDVQSLYQMAARQSQADEKEKDSWTCPRCGAAASGKFCPECGTPKPTVKYDKNGWTCPSCGTVNKGNFCTECGTKKPADAPKYKCDKCGWVPEDPYHPPKFCPECGDRFDENDIV